MVLLRENKKALLFTTYFPHPLLLILLATPCESRSLFWNRLHYQGVLVSKETYYIYLVSKETCYIYLVSKETCYIYLVSKETCYISALCIRAIGAFLCRFQT